MRFYRIIPTLTPKQELQFWSKVFVPYQPSCCWEWSGYKNFRGYGWYSVGKFTVAAHRVSYTLLVGPIPDGMPLDHLCQNKACVNPDHLEVVDNRTNQLRGYSPIAMNARQTHCIHGHEFTEENTYRTTSKPSSRLCRICRRKACVRYYRNKMKLAVDRADAG